MKKHIDGESARLARLLVGVSSCIVGHQMPATLSAITSLAAAFESSTPGPINKIACGKQERRWWARGFVKMGIEY